MENYKENEFIDNQNILDINKKIQALYKLKNQIEKKEINFKNFNSLQDFYSFMFKKDLPFLGAYNEFVGITEFNNFIRDFLNKELRDVSIFWVDISKFPIYEMFVCLDGEYCDPEENWETRILSSYLYDLLKSNNYECAIYSSRQYGGHLRPPFDSALIITFNKDKNKNKQILKLLEGVATRELKQKIIEELDDEITRCEKDIKFLETKNIMEVNLQGKYGKL